MNPSIGAFVGVSKQTEMLLMTVLALWVNIFDMAIFEISSNLDQVWNVEIDTEIFNSNAEYVIRMLLSGIVLVRTFTLHLYIAFLIAVFWPVCFGTRPTLMLPWLVVSAIKNLGTGLVSIATGGYTCMIYGPLRPACLRFLLSQLIDLSPSFYMWFVGLSLYCDLKKPKSVNRQQIKAMEDQELNVALRRRKVKSMIDEDILRQQFESRSFQKKFLGTSAVEVNEIINHCSYDNLKNKFSRSLDSLLDVLTVQTELLDIEDSEPLDINNSTTLQQKTAKLLGISMHEIDCIKQNRQTRTDFPVYPVQPQKKTPTITIINSRYESPAKLLPETSLYSPPNIKPIRVTKSEFKSAKDFAKIETEFMQSVPEKEMRVHDLTQAQSFESLTKMVYQSTNSSFRPDSVDDTDANMDSTNLLSTMSSESKEHGWEHSNIDRDKYSRRHQDRGKLEDVQIEISNKYRFANTMSDKSHYLLDEHCFLFDKESMLTRKDPTKVVSGYANRKRSFDRNQNQNKISSEQWHARLNLPNAIKDKVLNTNTKLKDNALSNKTYLNRKQDDKNNKCHLRKMKEDVVKQSKKISKQSEIPQTMKKKISNIRKMPSNDYSNIPVLHRSTKSANAHYNLIKTKVIANSENASKYDKNSVSQESKLYTIEENKDIASKCSHDEKSEGLPVNKVIEGNEIQTNEEEKSTSTLLKKESATPPIEIEKNNETNLKISSKKDLFEIAEKNPTSTIDQSEIINKRNYLRSIELGIPHPSLPFNHSSKRTTPPQKEVTNDEEEKIVAKEENTSLFSDTMLKSSQALSEKILQILKEKSRSKTDKISVEDFFIEKTNKTELFKNIKRKEFQFSAILDKKDFNHPAKSFRNKQLELHFKEKITKMKDNKMDDLFKKRNASERRDSKTSDKEKLGFPSYFSNKINRMITDACQIRKKSCKKINLFIKVPMNTSSKQRNKLSTIELFRKQSPQKTNLFDTSRKLSTGTFEIQPHKEDNKCDYAKDSNQDSRVVNRLEIDLFVTKVAQSNNQTEDLFSSYRPTSSISKTSEQSNNETINKIDEAQFISEQKHNLHEDMRNKTSLMNSFIAFKANEIKTTEASNIPHEINQDDELISLNKTKSLISSNTEIKEAKIDIAKYEMKTETPCKINIFQEKSNISNEAQKTSLPKISKNRTCKKLSEQALIKIMSITKTNYSKNTGESIINIESLNSCSNTCKRLSEQAINKIISLTKVKYYNFSNRKFITCAIDKKLNDSIIEETINNLKSKTSINIKNSNFILFPTTNTENRDEVTEGKNVSLNVKQSNIQINGTDSDNLKHFVSDRTSSEEDSNDLNKAFKVTENSSISVIEENPIICPKLPKIIPSSSTDFVNSDINSVHNSNFTLIEKTSMVIENEIGPIVATINNCKEISQSDSSSEEIGSVTYTQSSSSDAVFTAKNQQVDNNCKWTSQENISFISSNTINDLFNETITTVEENKNITDEKICEEVAQNFSENVAPTESESQVKLNSASKKDLSLKIENNKEKECITVNISEKSQCAIKINSNCNELMLTREATQTNTIKKEEKICNWTPQYCIQIVPSNSGQVEEKSSTSKSEEIVFVTKKEEANSKEKLETIPSNDVSETDISINKEEKDISENINNEFKATIPVVKVEKECKGTPQHRIKLISSTDVNYEKNSDNIEELISGKKSNVIKVKHTHENRDKLLSSHETPSYSSLALKKTKVCKGTPRHNIKLISSCNNESSGEINLNRDGKISSKIKNDLYIPLKEEKVCRGSSHNYIKLISPNKEEFASSTNLSHKEALSNILKEYQSVPIMKEEKICKGTSKHKIKLISSYKKDSPRKINLFHTEKQYNNDKNENITIFKEEKICKGTLQHSIELISSTKNDSENKTIVIVKEKMQNERETIPIIQEDSKDSVKIANKPSLQKNLFVNVNTANGKQNFTVIQNQKDDNDSAQSDVKNGKNFIVKNEMISTNGNDININKQFNMNKNEHTETFQKIALLSNTIKEFLAIDIEKLIGQTGMDLLSKGKQSDTHPLVDKKSSEILSSLIQKIETSLKSQESNHDKNKAKCYNYLKNQIDFGCQTSTLSKKVLENNPNEIINKLSATKSNSNYSCAKSYQDLNLQKLAFETATNKNSNSKLETKSNSDNSSKDEKRDSTINLNSRNSKNASYVSIHKERLEKAKNIELELNKSVIIHNCAFLEDGYTRLYNLLGLRREHDLKTQKKIESSLTF